MTLTKLRRAHRMTQGELAARVNASQCAVSRWEKGERVPTPEMIVRLSEVFDLLPGDVWEICVGGRQDAGTAVVSGQQGDC